MSIPVLVHYRPKPGQEAAFDAVLRTHTPKLQALGLATPRAPWWMVAADGGRIELFAWRSAEASSQAHQHPVVQAIWGQMGALCDFAPVGSLTEMARPFAHFTELVLPDPFADEGCVEVFVPAEGGQRLVRGALARPTGPGPFPAVIVLHEWWGLNADMRRVAHRLAEAGYLALALDLYDAEATTNTEEAWRLSNALRTEVAVTWVQAAVDWLQARPDATGRVGVTGFCLGGGLSLAAACTVRGLSAAAPFYGLPRPDFARWEAVTCAIEGHYGARDGLVGPDRVEPVWAAQRLVGLDTTLHWYEAGHAFMRARDRHVYDAAAADLAWERLLAFFGRTLID